MIDAAALAVRDMLSPPFRGVFWRSLGLTLALLAALWAALQWLLARWIALPWDWADTTFAVLTGIGLVVLLGFLVAPVAALFAGLFLDEIAEVAERTHYPEDPPGVALPLGRALVTATRFLGVVLLVNLLALPLVLLLGFGVLIFLGANAYLLGREYFELAALRHVDAATARRLRIAHAPELFLAGLLIAGFLAIPVVNLLAPLFATAFMVHVAKRLVGSSSPR
jgi:CysZ protein